MTIKDVLIGHAASGNPNGCRAALEQGAEVNAVDRYEMTAAHVAAYYGHTDCLRLLLDRGADLDLRDRDGHRPVDDAVRAERWSAAALLIRHGADVSLGHSQMARVLGADPHPAGIVTKIPSEQLPKVRAAATRKGLTKIVALIDAFRSQGNVSTELAPKGLRMRV